MSAKSSFALGFALLACSAATAAESWTWTMPASVYSALEFTIRSGVDRANRFATDADNCERRGMAVAELIPRWRLSAAEWKKVQIQAEADGAGEQLIAYAIFMQAYSQMRARDRNEATRRFQEVIDLYPDVVWPAVAARYFIARQKLDIGDVKIGRRLMTELSDDPNGAIRNHALMADAMLWVGNDCWNRKIDEDAVAYWKAIYGNQVLRDNNNAAWRSARGSLAFGCAMQADWPGMEAVIFAGINPEQHAKVCKAVVDQYNSLGWNWWRNPQAYFEARSKKADQAKAKFAKWIKLFAGWVASHRDAYLASENELEYELEQYRFAQMSGEKSPELAKRFQNLIAVARKAKTPDGVQRRLSSVFDFACSLGLWGDALMLCDYVQPADSASWKRYHVHCRTGKWTEALGDLEELLARKPSADERKKVLWKQAEIWRDRTREYDKAIKAYQEINEPPGTLWALQDAYRRAGKKKESYSALTEIASMFPNDAPDAVWTTACYKEQDGDKKTAIALYKRLLSQPEWKKSQASSRAHQALERHGIATGGAVINTVR